MNFCFSMISDSGGMRCELSKPSEIRQQTLGADPRVLLVVAQTSDNPDKPRLRLVA